MAMGVTGTAPLLIVRPNARINSYYAYELTTGAFTMMIGGTNFAPDKILAGQWFDCYDAVHIAGEREDHWHRSRRAEDSHVPQRDTTRVGRYDLQLLDASTAIKVNGGAGSGSGGSPQTVSVFVTPSTANVLKGASQQFSASVSNNANTSVTWSVTGGGTVSNTGLYTAPAVVPNPANVTVKATSNADTTKSATATVTVVEPPTTPVISSFAPAQLPFGAFSLTVNGSSFVAGAKVNIGGVALDTVFVSWTQLTTKGVTTIPQQGTNVPVTVTNGGQTPMTSRAVSIPVGVMNPLVSAAAAMRFLEQAAFFGTREK